MKGKFYFQPYIGGTSYKLFLNISDEDRNFDVEKCLGVLSCWGGADKRETLKDGKLLLGWEFPNDIMPAAKLVCARYYKESDPKEVWY